MSKSILQRPFFYDITIDDETIYFPMMFYNALCKGNLLDGEVEILDIFPEVPTYIYCAYRGIYKHNKYLLLSPHEKTNDKKDLLVYDTEACKFYKIENKKKIVFESNFVFEHKDYLYIISDKTGEISRLDFNNLSLEYMSMDAYKTDNASISEICKADEYIYIPINKRQIMLVFNLCTEEISYYNYPVNISSIRTLCYGSNKFWITTDDDRNLYTWKLNEAQADEIMALSDVKLFFKGSVWFGHSFIYKDVLWLFPVCADSILKYNIETKRLKRIELDGEEEFSDRIDEELKNGRCVVCKYVSFQRNDDKVFFLSSKTRILYELNLQNKDICKHILKVKNIFKNQLYPSIKEGIMYEANYINGIESLIRNLPIKDINILFNMGKNVGQSIYKFTHN